jgi:hypothetical protein
VIALGSEKRSIVPEESAQQPDEGQQPTSNKSAPDFSQETQAKVMSPHMSYWPFTLAVALCILFVGVILHPVVLWIGVALAVIAVIGWSLERQ